MKSIPRHYFGWQQPSTAQNQDMVRTPEGVMVKVQKRSKRGRKASSSVTQPLRDIRLSRGMTLEELAEVSQLSPSYISRLESGGRKLNSDTISRLTQALQCSAKDLVNETNSWTKNSAFDSAQPSPSIAPTYSAPPVTYAGGGPAMQPLLVVHGPLQANSSLDFTRPIGVIPCPPTLMGSPGAYAILVTDDSLKPHYNRGNCLLIKPGSPLVAGASAVVVTSNNQVIVGEFIAWHNIKDYTPKVSGITNPDGQMVLEIKQYNQIESQDTIEDKVVLQDSQILSTARVIGMIESI